MIICRELESSATIIEELKGSGSKKDGVDPVQKSLMNVRSQLYESQQKVAELKEQVEDRLKFYDSGDLPKKNVDAMKEAIDAVKAENSEFTEVTSKKAKKNKKRKAEAEVHK